MLDEVHLCTNCSTADNVVSREEHVKLQPCDDRGDEGIISTGKERDYTDQLLTVELDNILEMERDQ